MKNFSEYQTSARCTINVGPCLIQLWRPWSLGLLTFFCHFLLDLAIGLLQVSVYVYWWILMF